MSVVYIVVIIIGIVSVVANFKNLQKAHAVKCARARIKMS